MRLDGGMMIIIKWQMNKEKELMMDECNKVMNDQQNKMIMEKRINK